jgi:uncharacterized protein (TIGR02246 family)
MTSENLFEIVRALERTVWNIVVERDGAALADLFADDYIEITVDGKRMEKKEIVEWSPQVDEIDRYAVDAETVVTLGDDTVVLSYHLVLDGSSRGKTISPRERWATSIWSRRDGRWQCCFFQQSPFHRKDHNPWLAIPADEYDAHLAHPAVQQRTFLDRVFADALAQHKPRSIALLGCATGGGLEYVDAHATDRITAVDSNPAYLAATRSRYAGRLPQLELLEADLQTCDLAPVSYDLIHCALVLEYVDPEIVLTKAAPWLSARGALVVVLQLPSEEIAAVTPTESESLKLLAPIMTLHKDDDIRRLAARAGLVEQSSSIEQLQTGKQFFVAHFRHVK